MQKIAVALNRKHQAMLRLEDSLFGNGGARRVIANSEMVKREMMDVYSYPADRIDVVYNGVPAESFRSSSEDRARSRIALGLAPDDVAVLFVGSGWERKGLRFAIDAVRVLWRPTNASAGGGAGESIEIPIVFGAVPRCRAGLAQPLCGGGHFSAAHDLRSVFECLPRSDRGRSSCYHHERERLLRDHRERDAWQRRERSGGRRRARVRA